MLGEMLPIWSLLPFVGMLLSLAILPNFKPIFWRDNMFKIAIFWSLLFVVPFCLLFGINLIAHHLIETIVFEYLPFIVLLFGLYYITGGIAIDIETENVLRANVLLLLIGTGIASFVGTTGATMLIIRPLMQINMQRQHKAHVMIFLIFTAANMGGCLSPIGDPPLLLGFLQGVPFFWTLKLLPLFLFNTAILMLLFILIDKHYAKKELSTNPHLHGKNIEEAKTPTKKITVAGVHNLLLILLVLIAVLSSAWLKRLAAFADQNTGELLGVSLSTSIVIPYTLLIQIALILLAVFISAKTTDKTIKTNNHFTFEPIIEVAKIFVGIFITIIPAIELLKVRGAAFGITEAWQYFWLSGFFSSFLDNAPSYLSFITMAGSLMASTGIATTVGIIPEALLLAISAGAVFMGANTYIGNAPNLIVKTIAEENRIKMPSFFGYMRWSLCILIPLFILDTLLFFL